MMYSYSGPLAKLINEFTKMPGIGPKSAQRLAFYILSIDKESVRDLLEAIDQVKKNIKFCSRCFNISVNDLCDVCANTARETDKICVVAESKDLIAMERTNLYKGTYHVLGGVISPINGIGPEALRVAELMRRLQKEEISEIIFAFNPNVEGEATILYLSSLIKPLNIKVSRIAYGLPVGSDMDYADENTLSKSFEGRINL